MLWRDSVILTSGSPVSSLQCLRFLDSGGGDDFRHIDEGKRKDKDYCPHLCGQAEVNTLLNRERLFKAWIWPIHFVTDCTLALGARMPSLTVGENSQCAVKIIKVRLKEKIFLS